MFLFSSFQNYHVWMWELDYKESWAPKNWCFWAVMLEKTLESPLDCKETQLVHPKGNQSWTFIGRTDAETPRLWPPDEKSWLIGKDPDAGKDWRQEEMEMTDDEMVGWHHLLQWTGVWANSKVGDAIQPSHPLSCPSPPALNLSQHQGLFQWVSSSPQVAKMLEFHFQHQSFQLIFRMISFRMGWFDLLAVQGTLKSLLQHHSSKASILRRSAFLMVQLSHPYMTTGKTIALTRRTFLAK